MISKNIYKSFKARRTKPTKAKAKIHNYNYQSITSIKQHAVAISSC